MINRQKMQIYDKQAQVFKAIAHPLRIAILDFLSDGPKCVCDIAAHVTSERSNVSKHLSVMLNAGLLEQRKDGLNVIYKVKRPCVLKFLSCTCNFLKQNITSDTQLLEILK
jgi:ArsR family transcriptional regulator